MRISDWSSDVCSSDLLELDRDTQPIELFVTADHVALRVVRPRVPPRLQDASDRSVTHLLCGIRVAFEIWVHDHVEDLPPSERLAVVERQFNVEILAAGLRFLDAAKAEYREREQIGRAHV